VNRHIQDVGTVTTEHAGVRLQNVGYDLTMTAAEATELAHALSAAAGKDTQENSMNRAELVSKVREAIAAVGWDAADPDLYAMAEAAVDVFLTT
jgi:hypothetical protein